MSHDSIAENMLSRDETDKMKILLQDLKQWYFDLFYTVSLPPFAEFGDWVCVTEELESLFEATDYLLLLETDFTAAFDVIAIQKLLKKYLPQIEPECESFLLRRKLENALRLPFLVMVEELTDMRYFCNYPLTELGITDYHDGDVVNFLNIYSPHMFTLTPLVDEKTYEDYFPNFKEQIRQAIDWLRTGEILIIAEGEEGREKNYHIVDRRVHSVQICPPSHSKDE